MRIVLPEMFMQCPLFDEHIHITLLWEVGTLLFYTCFTESKSVKKLLAKEKSRVREVRAKIAKSAPPPESDPKIEALVREIIERVADKWTMLVLEVLAEHGVVRFTRLGELVGGISQKMLTKTVRQMEYELTELGHSLGAAFCGVWIWAEEHHDQIIRARKAFQAEKEPS
jgi:DNA-binding HxlR family transcriptional regulator